MGSGFRTFASGETLTSSNVQNYLMDQSVMVFAGTAARGSAIASPESGMITYRTDGTADSGRAGFEFYNGTSWTSMISTSGILQVQSTLKTDAFSTTSATFTDVTGVSVSITPRATSSKILVMAHIQGSQGATNDGMFRLMRDSTVIAESTAGTTNGYGQVSASYANAMFTISIAFLDSPSTTSATTYKVQTRIVGGATVFVNRRAADTSYGGSSTITVMEVAG